MPYVYKYVLNDEIIYIGKSDRDDFSRLRSHGNGNNSDNIPTSAHGEIDAAEIFIATFPDPVITDVVESLLISQYRPKYNVRVTNRYDILTCNKIEWIPFAKLQNEFDRKYPTLYDILWKYDSLRVKSDYENTLLKQYQAENETLKQTIKILTDYCKKGDPTE